MIGQRYGRIPMKKWLIVLMLLCFFSVVVHIQDKMAISYGGEKESLIVYEANADFPLYLIKVSVPVLPEDRDLALITFMKAFSNIRFCPTMRFINPPEGQVACYAGYTMANSTYTAFWDVDGNIFFKGLINTKDLISYDVYDFKGKDTWQSMAFEYKILRPEMIIKPGVVFLFGITPAGGGYETLQGAMFQFIEEK